MTYIEYIHSRIEHLIVFSSDQFDQGLLKLIRCPTVLLKRVFVSKRHSFYE